MMEFIGNLLGGEKLLLGGLGIIGVAIAWVVSLTKAKQKARHEVLAKVQQKDLEDINQYLRRVEKVRRDHEVENFHLTDISWGDIELISRELHPSKDHISIEEITTAVMRGDLKRLKEKLSSADSP